MGTLNRLGALIVALGLGACNDLSGDSGDLGSRTAAVLGRTNPGVHRAVIVKAKKPYDRLVRTIEEMGGTVKHQYRFVDAIAAEVPEGGLPALRGLAGANAVVKDVYHDAPRVTRSRFATPARVDRATRVGRALDAAEIEKLPAEPDGYLVNALGYMNMAPLFAAGYDGAGVTVAIIDDGLIPGVPLTELDGSVIGGENETADGIPFIDERNGGHGQFVSGMVSGNAAFLLDPASDFAQSVATHCPRCVIPDEESGGLLLPIIGSAPSSNIYMLKVFPSDGSPTLESDIIAAMERVLLLKLAYLNGAPEVQNPDGSYDALNIQVTNMSLGGQTLFAGRDIFDQLTRAFTEMDIVLTKSAGNAGPSGTTGGSPGTGFGGLTVGAASVAANERIVMDLIFGNGFGELWRASTHMQTASFSARGPTADGRLDPDLVSSGDWNVGQFTGDDISFGSGTSFSSPSVAGVAATVRQAVPWATAEQVQAALVQGADPSLIKDGSGVLDRGAGYVNGTRAALLLLSHGIDIERERRRAHRSVAENVERLVQVVRSSKVTRRARNLLPGQRYELYYDVKPSVGQVKITLSDVVPGATQNEIFGDDILLTVHSAKTHVAGEGDYLAYTFTTGRTIVLDDPEPGLVRVTLNGDWTNASPISASVTIESTRVDTLPKSARGRIVEGQSTFLDFEVPEGVAALEVELRWKGDWSRYPTSDLDVYAFDPEDNVFFDGATLTSPEHYVIAEPLAGPWTFQIDGFTVFNGDDKWELSVVADGKRLEPNR